MLRINLDSGVLDTGHAVNADGAKGSIVLEKDAWNTVSLVIDLDSGAVVYYVNNVKTFEGVFSFGYNFTTQKTDGEAAKISPENITLKAGQWIVAKLMEIPDITFCPHGRPVAMELSHHTLDKQFDRTGF
jgi:hypothetical protein